MGSLTDDNKIGQTCITILSALSSSQIQVEEAPLKNLLRDSTCRKERASPNCGHRRGVGQTILLSNVMLIEEGIRKF